MPASVSGAFSRWTAELLADLFHIGGEEAQEGHGLLRKLAHFSEFTSLGFILTWMSVLVKRKAGLTFLCGFLAACVDETIQRFVPGRGPSIWDVMIDTSGVALGVSLFLLGLKIYQKINIYWRTQNYEETDFSHSGTRHGYFRDGRLRCKGKHQGSGRYYGRKHQQDR